MLTLVMVFLAADLRAQIVAPGTPTTRPAAAETIPPAPPSFVHDESSVLTRATLRELNDRLQQFEQDTTNQVVVAIYPTMQSKDDIGAYATRVANAWGIGQKGKDNGVLLLVFTGDRALYIAVGKGLEPTLTNAQCKRIIDQQIIPQLRRGDYNAAIRAGVTGITTTLAPK